MKNLILLVLLSPLALVASHNHQGELKIQSDNNQNIMVEVDGRSINWFPSRKVTARNLDPGYHQLQVSSVFYSMGTQRQQIIFRGEIFIEPDRTTVAFIDRTGRLYLNGQGQGHQPHPSQQQGQRMVCGMCHQQYVGQHQCGVSYQGSQHGTYGQYYQGGYGHNPYQGYYPNHYGYGQYQGHNQYQGYGQSHHGNTNRYGAMSNQAFRALKDMIEDASFESTKLSVAKQGVERNWITSRQLRDILELFSFESTRVNFARWAYDYVVDPENIFVIYKALDFDSSKCDLGNFFSSR